MNKLALTVQENLSIPPGSPVPILPSEKIPVAAAAGTSTPTAIYVVIGVLVIIGAFLLLRFFKMQAKSS